MNVYIAGIGRSGSTFFSRYIDQYENVFSSGEFFPGNIFSNSQMICSCGKNLTECDYHKFLVNQLTLEETNFLKHKVNHLLDFNSVKNKIRFYPNPIFLERMYTNLFNYDDAIYYSSIIDKLKIKTLEFYNKNIFIDASKQYYMLSLYFKGGISLPKIVHIQRNPLGVFESNKRNNPGLNVGRFVKSWKRSELCISRLVKKYNLNYHKLNFDEFTRDPLIEIEKLSNFFEMELGAFSEGKIQHVLGNNNVRKANELVIRKNKLINIELEDKEIEFIKKKLSL